MLRYIHDSSEFRKRMPSSRLVLLVLASLALLSGCGESKPSYRLTPVTGRVTIDGQPVASVEVEFRSDSGIRALAVSDGTGQFTVETPGHGRGIPPENYIIRARGTGGLELPPVYEEEGVRTVTIAAGENPPVEVELRKSPPRNHAIASDSAQK